MNPILIDASRFSRLPHLSDANPLSLLVNFYSPRLILGDIIFDSSFRSQVAALILIAVMIRDRSTAKMHMLIAGASA